jgi:hypothetical protein
MPLMGFERKISAGERPQTHASDRAATGAGFVYVSCLIYFFTGSTIQSQIYYFIVVCIVVLLLFPNVFFGTQEIYVPVTFWILWETT